MSIGRFGLELFHRYPGLFIGNLMIACFLAFIDAATLASIAPIVSLLTNGEGNDAISPYVSEVLAYAGIDGSITVYLSIFVCLTVCSSALLIVINYLILRAQFIVRDDMVLGSSELVLNSGMQFLNAQRQGEFINTLTLEAARVADSFTALTRMVAPIAQAVVLLWIPFAISWELTLVSIAVATALLAPLKFFRTRVYEYGQAHTSANNDFSTALQETLQNTRLIIGFANISTSLERLRNTFGMLRSASIKLQFVQSTVYALHGPIGIVVVFVTFLTSRHLGVELAEVAVILYAFNRLAGTVATINQNRSNLVSLYPSYEQVMKIRSNAEQSTAQFGDQPFSDLQNEITLKDVTFAYRENEPVLESVNLSIKANRMTALIGVSGSGKSTVADLVMGLLETSDGQIFVDGTPIQEIEISTFRRKLGYVPQRTSLFHASVHANVAWAKPDASREEVIEACRMANADDFILRLEDGYDTVVGDQGQRLSGGQAQRISLARALIRKPTLLVLDEATSALDTESEQLIQSAIEGIIGHTTILVIAHRLSTIKKADNIALMEHGRIVVQGRFDDLMNQHESFSRLVKMQQL